MKIGIYNEPCGGGLGGTEVSVAVLAGALAKNHEVEIIHQRPAMTLKSLSQFASVNLHNVSLKLDLSAPRRLSLNLWSRYLAERRAEMKLSKSYDLFIVFVHGVPPYCAAHNSVLVVLFPFLDLKVASMQSENYGFSRIPKPLLSIWRQWKWRANLNSYKAKVAISEFARQWTKRRWNIESQVIFPPVDTDVQVGEKTNRILSVGRFAISGHGKKQIEMLQIFKQLKASGYTDWDYDSAGGCGTSDEELTFLQEVKQLGGECGANILDNISHEQLKNLYRKAKIFWHAAGLGVDDNLQPELTEHFGITTVEAMAAGCVPVVINKGGQPEIVEHGISGFLWNTPEECKQYTIRLMQDEALLQKMSSAARERAQRFSREAFVGRFHSLLKLCFNQ